VQLCFQFYVPQLRKDSGFCLFQKEGEARVILIFIGERGCGANKISKRRGKLGVFPRNLGEAKKT
jgi:hypothetical protein